jgi:hypothetical protein
VSVGLSNTRHVEQLRLYTIRIAADDCSSDSCSASDREYSLVGFYVQQHQPTKRNLGRIIYIFAHLTIMYLHFTVVKAIVCLRLSLF